MRAAVRTACATHLAHMPLQAEREQHKKRHSCHACASVDPAWHVPAALPCCQPVNQDDGHVTDQGKAAAHGAPQQHYKCHLREDLRQQSTHGIGVVSTSRQRGAKSGSCRMRPQHSCNGSCCAIPAGRTVANWAPNLQASFLQALLAGDCDSLLSPVCQCLPPCLRTFQALPPAHSANASYVGLPVAPAARINMQLVASLAHATTNIVRQPTSTPVLLMAKGIGRMELQAQADKRSTPEHACDVHTAVAHEHVCLQPA